MDAMSIFYQNTPATDNCVGGKVMHSLLQHSEICPCHILPVGRITFASHVANLGLGCDPLVYPILHLLPLSERPLDMTEILLTETKSLNSINQKLTTAFLNRPYGEHNTKNKTAVLRTAISPITESHNHKE